jgi:hypothetical protein
MKVDMSLKTVLRPLNMFADVLHIAGKMFLVSVSGPLKITLQSRIESENRMALRKVLQGQLEVLRSRGFMPETVYMDPHSMFRSMTPDFHQCRWCDKKLR